MSSISIESKSAVFSGNSYTHLYLIYTDDSGNERVIRGGIDGNPLSPTFGRIVIEAGVEIHVSLDSRGTDTPEQRGHRVLDLNGRNADDVWNIMIQQILQIANAGLSYQLITQNSNSTIASVLHAVGIDIAQNIPTNTTSDLVLGEENLLSFGRALNGTEHDDIIHGYNQNDVLTGGAGSDRLFGEGGNDILKGGSGDDILDGGTGTDTVRYESAAKVNIIETPVAPTNVIHGSRETDAIVGIEKIEGTAAADDFHIRLLNSGTALREINTGAGNDKVDIEGGVTNLTIRLGDGDDTLKSSSHGAIIYTGSGHDVIDIQQYAYVMDADANDHFAYYGDILTGGVRAANSELGWANGVRHEKYDINPAGDLIITDVLGRQTFIANYNSNPNSGSHAGNILVGTFSLEAFRLIENANDDFAFKLAE